MDGDQLAKAGAKGTDFAIDYFNDLALAPRLSYVFRVFETHIAEDLPRLIH